MGISPLSVPAYKEPPSWYEGKNVKWILIGGALVVLLIVWLWGSVACSSYKITRQAIDSFHAELDRGEYQQIYDHLSEDFIQSGTKAKNLQFFEMVHNKMGNTGKVSMLGFHFNKVNGVTLSITSCRAQFANGEAIENFTWRIKDNQAWLVGYRINSPAVH